MQMPFRGIYEPYGDRDGQMVEVLAIVPDDEGDEPLYQIRFSDGVEYLAWPEEVLAQGAPVLT